MIMNAVEFSVGSKIVTRELTTWTERERERERERDAIGSAYHFHVFIQELVEEDSSQRVTQYFPLNYSVVSCIVVETILYY